MEFKDRIKQLRQERGLSQVQLGTLLQLKNTTIASWEQGLSTPTLKTCSTVQQYESDKRKPNTSIVIKLTEIFSVTSDYLLGLSEIREPLKTPDLTHFSTDELFAELKRRCIR